MLTCAAELVCMLHRDEQKKIHRGTKSVIIGLEPQEQQLYDFLQPRGKHQLDAKAVGYSFKTVGLLLKMELKGAIWPLSGKLFEAF